MNKHLKLSSQHIKDRDGLWWLETPEGLEFHVEVKSIDVDRFTGQAVFIIDWRTIRRALKRKDMK